MNFMDSEALSGFVALALVIGGYFLPTIVASNRKHRNRGAIGMLNLLLGWTLLGWIIALIWAMTANVEGTDFHN